MLCKAYTGLYKAFDEKGIGYAKTAVGDKYVYEYMAKNGCRIGGEQSGHIIFSKLNVETGLLECYTNITIIFWRFYYAQN